MEVKSRKVSKIFIVIFLVLGLIGPFLLNACFTGESFENNSMEAQAYVMDVVIDDNGDMHVVEKITIDNYRDNYNNYFYKEIAYNKNNMFGNSSSNTSSLKKNVQLIVEDDSGIVYDSQTTMNNYPYHFSGFSYNNDVDERGVRVRCQTSYSYCDNIFYYNNAGFAEITTFTYKYTIEGVITQYNDISEFNWVMLDYQPFKFNNIRINITLPNGDYNIEHADTFFHGTAMASREFIANNKILITADDLVSDEQIEVRLLLDNQLFANVDEINKVDINAREDILAFEEEQTRSANIRYIVGNVIAILLYVIYILIMFVIAFICYIKHDKEYKADFYNEYYRELPASYPPSVMGYLYKFGEINDDDLTATLLDLIRRKYLILDTNGSSNEDKNPNYIILLNKDKQQDDLTESEKYLIKWFIDEIGDREKVTSQELSSFCKDYNKASKYQQCSNTWYKLVKEEAKKYNFFEKDNFKFKGKYIGFGVLFTVVFSIAFMGIFSITRYPVSYGFIMGVYFFMFALIVYVSSVNRRTIQGNEDFVRWKAFKKFLGDFASFEDYPVPSLIIWEHYLVYATSFGIADKVSEQLKLKFNLEQIYSTETTFMVYFGVEHRISRFHRTIYGMRMMSNATIASTRVQRSGGSFGGRSGGGFSGGSSFGGGGGSFGGGRR